jgi:RNA-splicing ligase RtcB
VQAVNAIATLRRPALRLRMQVLVMIHAGSRGLGHQVCDFSTAWEAMTRYG